MAVRVNAAGTDIAFAHQVTGRNDDGLTIRYRDGPKAGLEIHFFGEAELRGLFRGGIRAGDAPARPDHPATAARDRPVDPVGGHLARKRVARCATLRVNIPCAAPADLATMSGAKGGDGDLDG